MSIMFVLQEKTLI